MNSYYVYPNFIKIGNVARSDGGMTMREYYIGQALQGITSATMNYQREWTGQMTPDWVAEAAIKHADAVMKLLIPESKDSIPPVANEAPSQETGGQE